MTEEKEEKAQSMSKDDANFLARQIVDDLIRAGLPATRYQHVVEETLLQWAVMKNKRPDGTYDCELETVKEDEDERSE